MPHLILGIVGAIVALLIWRAVGPKLSSGTTKPATRR